MPFLSSETRLYPVSGMVVGAMLGSLAAAIYMTAANYFAMERPALARQTLLGGAALFALIVLLPMLATPLGFGENANPLLTSIVMALIQGWLASFFGSRLQGAAIAHHRQSGGEVHGLGRSILTSILVVVAMLFLLVTIVLPISIILNA